MVDGLAAFLTVHDNWPIPLEDPVGDGLDGLAAIRNQAQSMADDAAEPRLAAAKGLTH
jgi:hypothetical protein